jgi:GntR family transcriptional regulator, vanillate catabolism transcriptional regulator
MGLNSVAYQRIKEMILRGIIPMGTRLLETRLVPLLQMSRTPIREALQQLHAEGMLEEDADGLLTKKYTRTQILEIYHCRAILEGEAIKLIAETGFNETAAAKIHQVISTCDDILLGLSQSSTELEARFRNSFLIQNNIFHDTLYSICPNAMLLSMLRRTEELPEAIRNYASFSYEQLLASHLGHKQIVRAIEMRDAERAAALMKEHIWAARDRMDPETYETMRFSRSTKDSVSRPEESTLEN